MLLPEYKAVSELASGAKLLSVSGSTAFRFLRRCTHLFWSADGSKLWTIHDPDLLACWSVPEGKRLAEHSLETDDVLSVLLSSDEQVLLTTNDQGKAFRSLPYENTFAIADPFARYSSAEEHFYARWHRASNVSSPSPKTIHYALSSLEDELSRPTLCWHSLEEPPLHFQIGGLRALSPNGKLLASVDNTHQHLQLWDSAGRLLWKIPADSYFAEFSPDGRFLLSARPLDSNNPRYFAVSVLSLYDVHSGTLLWERTLERESPILVLPFLSFRFVQTAAQRPAVWVLHSSPTLLALDTGETLHSFSIPPWRSWSERWRDWSCLQLSPDAQTIACSTPEELLFFDASTGRPLEYAERIPGGIQQVTIAPDNARIAHASPQGFVQVQSNENATKEWSFEGLTPPLTNLFFSHDGTHLFATNANELIAWSLSDGSELLRHNCTQDSAALHAITKATLHPSGELLCVAGRSALDPTCTTVVARRPHTGEILWTQTLTNCAVTSLRFATDENHLVVCGSNAVVCLLHSADGRVVPAAKTTPRNPSPNHFAACVDPRVVITAEEWNVKRWTKGKPTPEEEPSNTLLGRFLELSPRGTFALIGQRKFGGAELWHCKKRLRNLGPIALEACKDAISAATFSNDEAQLVLATTRGAVLVYDLRGCATPHTRLL